MPRKGSDPLVIRLEPLRPRGLRVRIHLDRGDPLEVVLEALERVGIGVGDPLTPTRRTTLLDVDADIRVREAALNLLSHRARTRAELRRKLLGKDFAAARVDACLDRMEERGLLDDAAVASAFVRDRLRFRPRGKGRMAQELRSKGVADDVARQVVDTVLEEEDIDEDDLVRRVLEGWMKRQGASTLDALASSGRSVERDKARRRLQGYLIRRGFGGGSLGRALELAPVWAASSRR